MPHKRSYLLCLSFIKQIKFSIMKKILIVAIATITILSACKKDNTSTDITYNAAYVVNGSSNSISVINLSNNTVARTINLTGVSYPHHIALSPDKTKIIVGVPGMDLSNGHSNIMAGMTGMFIVLDAVTGNTLKTVSLPMMNHNAIFSPNGTEIWTSQMDSMGKVLVYDATTYALKKTIDVGMMPLEVTFSKDATMAFVCNSMDSTVSAIDINTKAIMSNIQVNSEPIGAWQGADNKMYVDCEEAQKVNVVDVSSMSVYETVNLGFMPGMAQMQNTVKELWATDPMAGKVHWWTWDTGMNMWMHAGEVATGAGAHAIAFNGNTAYITNQTAGTVSVLNVTTHTVTNTLTVGSKPNGLVLKL